MRKITLKIAGALLLAFTPSAISDNIASLAQTKAGIRKTSLPSRQTLLNNQFAKDIYVYRYF
jgi:hypothetical protein